MLPPHLARAYHKAQYNAAGHAFRIGRKAPALDAVLRALGVAEAVLITAWNPRSRRMTLACNARRQAALLACARAVPQPGSSAGLGWAEEMVLLPVSPRRGARLGRRFRQAAIVVLRRGQAPRVLSLL